MVRITYEQPPTVIRWERLSPIHTVDWNLEAAESASLPSSMHVTNPVAGIGEYSLFPYIDEGSSWRKGEEWCMILYARRGENGLSPDSRNPSRQEEFWRRVFAETEASVWQEHHAKDPRTLEEKNADGFIDQLNIQLSVFPCDARRSEQYLHYQSVDAWVSDGETWSSVLHQRQLLDSWNILGFELAESELRALIHKVDIIEEAYMSYPAKYREQRAWFTVPPVVAAWVRKTWTPGDEGRSAEAARKAAAYEQLLSERGIDAPTRAKAELAALQKAGVDNSTLAERRREVIAAALLAAGLSEEQSKSAQAAALVEAGLDKTTVDAKLDAAWAEVYGPGTPRPRG